MEILSTVLLNTLSDQYNIRVEAEKQLDSYIENTPIPFLQSLTTIISEETFDSTLRNIAAITFKNSISGKAEEENKEKADRWLSISNEESNSMKEKLVCVLNHTNDFVSKAVCQIISKIARIELPTNKWPDLLPHLLTLLTSHPSHSKRAALTCLQYLTEEMAEILEDYNTQLLTEEQNNQILTTVVQGMLEPDTQVREAACKAFFHCVLFAKTNFEDQNERNIIFDVVLKTCNDKAVEVRQRGFECLVQIASVFYEHMEPYMNDILPLTIEGIESKVQSVAIPALEFWNSICDEEILIKNLEKRAKNRNLVFSASPFLLPILLNSLIQPDNDEYDHDDWTIAKSAAICISLIAQVVGDGVLSVVIQFVNKYSMSSVSREREGAVLAYGCIMEGPEKRTLCEVIRQSFGNVCMSMSDICEDVRDTAAWTVGRIVAFDADTVIPLLGDINNKTSPINIILNAFTDTPRVASHACWIVQQISIHTHLHATFDQHNHKHTTLDPLFHHLCQHLINVTARHDASEKNLMEAAFNTMISLIHGVGDDCLPLMKHLYDHFLKLLDQSLSMEKTTHVEQYQGLICGCLQVLITRLQGQAYEFADRTWNCLVNILSTSKYSPLSEDALLTTSALANVLDSEFEKYMESLQPIILMGLYHPEEIATCKICIELVGDVSRSLRERFCLYCQLIMNELYKILADVHADRSLKPIIMITLGDIAMSITHRFEPYLHPFMQLLDKAAHTDISLGPKDDMEWIMYLTELRDSVLQVYSGFVYGLRDGNKKDILQPFVTNMLEIIQIVVEEEEINFSYSNLLSAIDLTGDLIGTFDSNFVQYLYTLKYINTMIVKGLSIPDNLSKEDDPSGTIKECKNRAKKLHTALQQYSQTS